MKNKLNNLQAEYRNVLLLQLDNEDERKRLEESKFQLSGAIQIISQLIEEKKETKKEEKKDANKQKSS